jgi:putative hydrolase of the HAD superfamily
MSQYKHIFFDLDRTLWDFETNTLETFRDIFEKYKLSEYFSNYIDFHQIYTEINQVLWQNYLDGKLKKEILRTLRFQMTLERNGLNNFKLAEKIGLDYITMSPLKTALFPNTIETLERLKKKYQLHIITNGFNEVQFVKIKNCGLEPFFTSVVTSEKAGFQKPRREIFDYALNSVNAKKKESLMVGDDYEIDIAGARNAGIDQVYFNPAHLPMDKKPTYEIHDLKDLQKIL